ncbi:hypothetical protein SAMN06297251_10124 [Fulvimarina manganoxydans]|uniref:Uncharacterized protein n=1 Tax=Fulvimarina manganoxydans TaxID=937218 RepID=A0A1W1Y897_9HYPH|nr:hypothetical protein [Fulvimarina manganoxydans]SMC32392.1 hypothetical protein SAMN06297251_10124 [Fulvimarina manganoxydans]
MIRALAALATALAISGCTTTRTVLVPPPSLADRIPPQLLACRDRPAAGDLARQSDVARWVVEMDAAGEDCRRKVSAIRSIVERDGRQTEGE